VSDDPDVDEDVREPARPNIEPNHLLLKKDSEFNYDEIAVPSENFDSKQSRFKWCKASI